jgi:4-hydroxy 2-oxovalerate aldolase
MNEEIDITAIIPVRSGSIRCPRKNTRIFCDTTLLEKKIKLLKQVPNIKSIIVSTSDSETINWLTNLDKTIKIHNRDPIYSQSSTSGNELYKCLSEAVDTPHMMYVTCVTPFVPRQDYLNAINLYINFCKTKEFDSVVSCHNNKQFFWKDSSPLNYNSLDTPPSQLLPDIYNLSFAFNILPTNIVLSNSTIVGQNPYFYELDQLSSIDIDTEFDFVISELLYKNQFNSMNNISNYISLSQEKEVYLLDCTIRDGGFLNNWNYSMEYVIEFYNMISKTGIDFFECGFICNKQNDQNGVWWSLTPDVIKQLKISTNNGCKLAAMISMENIHELLDKIPELDMIRVLVNLKKSNISHDSISHLNRLHNLGYIVTLNIAYIDILDESELNSISSLASDSISSIYIADTFGSITSFTLLKYIRTFENDFKNIGFHGHNNTGLAISNSLLAIDSGVKYIDCTLSGFGRGGGNTPTELIILYLNEKYNKNYNILPVFNFLNNTQKINNNEKLKILYTLSGIHKKHPNLILDILNSNNFDLEKSFEEFLTTFKNLK